MQSSSFLSSLASWLVEPVGTRLHLIELHESEWCPARLRSAVVETLQLGWSTLPLPPLAFSPLVRDRFLAFAKQCEADTVLDMCSGGGGPLPHALGVEDSEEANEKVLNVVLTDLFPQTSLWMQQAAGRSNVHFCPKPVDATAVSVASVLGDCRTCSKGGSSETSTPAPLIYRKGAVIRSICGALHHFTPDLLRSMLGDAVRAGDAVLFVEAVERTPLTILSFQFIPWIICYILPPMLLLMRLLSYGPASRASKRDFWSAWIHRCVFTYMFPIIPFIIWLDGFVSCLRTYSKGEFLAVAASVDVERRFDWTVTREVGPSGVGVLVTYTGRPVNRDNAVADTGK